MKLIQYIKFSLSATKSFVVFIIEVWKGATKWEKDMKLLSKNAVKIAKHAKEYKKQIEKRRRNENIN